MHKKKLMKNKQTITRQSSKNIQYFYFLILDTIWIGLAYNLTTN